MVKLRFCVFFLFLCCACHEKMPLPGEILCCQIDSIYLNFGFKGKKFDSIALVAQKLPKPEHFAVLCNLINRLPDEMRQNHYLRELRSISFPKIKDKASGFLLLKQYSESPHLFKTSSDLINVDGLATLLFDMGNKWSLSPEEKCQLLIMKSNVYYNIFKEYKSSLLIAAEADKLAREYKINNYKTSYGLYKNLIQNYFIINEPDSIATFSYNLLNAIDQHKLGDEKKETIYNILHVVSMQQKDYSQAHYWLTKSKRKESKNYIRDITKLYSALDSTSLALNYINESRKKEHHPLVAASMYWDEACVYLKMGDTSKYETCLTEAIRLIDIYNNENEIDAFSPSEAYARLLWEQGKRKEAISRMELVKRKVRSSITHSKTNSHVALGAFDIKIKHVRLLTDYYRDAGRFEDALNHALFCDSIQRVWAGVQLNAEKNKNESRMYTIDLTKKLERKTVDLEREQQKRVIIGILLGITVLILTGLFFLYRQREKQIAVLYARQKEIEFLQQEKQKLLLGIKEELAPEEHLFRELEERFYKEQLFRNPGFSRDDLCRLGGSNRMYISTCINKYAGANINQWINKARVDYAITLLKDKDADLQQISDNSGFASIKSFFRNFKKFTNLTPKQYMDLDRQQQTKTEYDLINQ